MDRINWADPQPIASIPLLSGTRLELLRALQQGKSYYEISLLFPKLIEDAESVPRYLRNDKTNHVAVLEKMQDPRSKIWRIFHTIPRDMLQSLILGTVAFDFSRVSERPETYRDMNKWGIYIVSISVLGRSGKWLSANELDQVIVQMKKYIEGYEAWKDHRGNPLTGAHKELHDWMCRIDNVYGLHDAAWGPRFIYKDEALRGWQAFISRLEHRRDASLAVDPTGKTWMIQAPVYTGCSTILEDRSEKYDPSKGIRDKLKGVSKSYGLLMSIMANMNRQPLHVCKCVLRLWKRDEIPIAEVLVAALANSYITQDGLNRETCGGESGLPRKTRTGGRPRRYSRVDELEAEISEDEAGDLFDPHAEEYVKARECFFFDNIDGSLRELTARQVFVDEFAHLQRLVSQPETGILDMTSEAQGQITELKGIAKILNTYKGKDNEYAKEAKQIQEGQNFLELVIELEKLMKN